jgi:hypothetical protein
MRHNSNLIHKQCYQKRAQVLRFLLGIAARFIALSGACFIEKINGEFVSINLAV